MIFAEVLFAGCPAFGRANRRRSHYLVVCADAKRREVFKVTPALRGALRIPAERETLVELRGNGHYSMVPPSIHTSGERVEWQGEQLAFPRMPWSEARRRCGLIALLALALRKYPSSPRPRQNARMALKNVLLSVGVEEDQTDGLVTRLAEHAGDMEGQQETTTVSELDFCRF